MSAVTSRTGVLGGAEGRVRRVGCRLRGGLDRTGPVPLPPTDATSKLVVSGATNVAPNRRVEVFELARVLGVQSARLSILALDGLVHLLPVHGDFDGGRDPQPNLVAPDIHHGDDN